MSLDHINFTPELFDKLKRQYTDAVKTNASAFTFEGRAILTSYAKYMIEYLETRFGSK